MIQSHFKFNLRALRKNISHTIINVTGLCLGISSALIIFLVVRYEMSFDSFHSDKDRIFRMVSEKRQFGNVRFGADMPYPLPEALGKDFPDIEYVTITDSNLGDIVISIPQKEGPATLFKETSYSFVDPGLLQNFSLCLAGRE